MIQVTEYKNPNKTKTNSNTTKIVSISFSWQCSVVTDTGIKPVCQFRLVFNSRAISFSWQCSVVTDTGIKPVCQFRLVFQFKSIYFPTSIFIDYNIDIRQMIFIGKTLLTETKKSERLTELWGQGCERYKGFQSPHYALVVVLNPPFCFSL